MLNTFFATKLETNQTFDNQGNRLAITLLKALPLTVTQVKTSDKDGYWAVQVAIGKGPLYLREIHLAQTPDLKPGDQIVLSQVFKIGDKVKVTGLSKGRGFSGVMKRHGFSGGPKTHGQSDRSRAPGSIGMRTTPGRVWKGKKMPGHYGMATKTIRNLTVISLDDAKQTLVVSGTVPASRRSLISITKTKAAKEPSNG